jgi:hypothetical protein
LASLLGSAKFLSNGSDEQKGEQKANPKRLSPGLCKKNGYVIESKQGCSALLNVLSIWKLLICELLIFDEQQHALGFFTWLCHVAKQ